MMETSRRGLALVLGLATAFADIGTAPAQETVQVSPAMAPADKGMATLTVFLRHDESQTLGEINDRLRRQHFYESFPPPGVEVVSWTVAMGIGQVVVLRFPAERLREINRALEQTAWGGYRTEFYPTYDYRPTAAKEREGLPSAFK